MHNISRALAVALMAATIPATIVVAQQTSPADKPVAEKTEELRRGPSKETLERMFDGRIAEAKAVLRLSAEQEPLWAPVEEKIRANFADRQAARESWAEKRAEKRAERRAERAERAEQTKQAESTASEDDDDDGERADRDGDRKRERLALPERLEKRSEHMAKRAEMLTKHAEKSKELAAVLKPLYESFSDDQKAVAGKTLGRLVKGDLGHGKHGHKGGKRHHDRGNDRD